MAEGGFDDFEIENMGEKYSEYDDINYGQLDYEYNRIQDLLTDDQKIKNDEEKREYTERSEYLLKLIRKKKKNKKYH